MKHIYRWICIIFAFVCVGMGLIGVFLPILPTTPFLILATVLFARGSKRFHHWFLSTKLYRNHVDRIVNQKAMTRRGKCLILSTVTVLLTVACVWVEILWIRGVLILVGLFHYYYFLFRLRTCRI
ncbi:YbaN family protein [Anaerosporobacter faecicola]|uniref:YbaN family protein n=1 Tax=Anaerosporobacter faecicola TaxID=2718714 RepID=UPI00143BC6B4|nr:YbaN family protein [Anaerosporobacter faecicola]